jgi:hypothetical protein
MSANLQPFRPANFRDDSTSMVFRFHQLNSNRFNILDSDHLTDKPAKRVLYFLALQIDQVIKSKSTQLGKHDEVVGCFDFPQCMSLLNCYCTISCLMTSLFKQHQSKKMF